MKKSPLVSIIILTYGNGWVHLKKCLDSLLILEYSSIEIIIVDNASTDNTVKNILGSRYKKLKIRLIKFEKNKGFCVGNNEAYKKANGKYILFLNNDTIVTPIFLFPLVNILENNKKIAIVQPKIRQLINTNKLDACGSFLTNTGFLYHYGYSQNEKKYQYNKTINIYSVKGACFLAKKSIIDKIGLFDEDFFAYFEETDFCHRVWLYGYRIVYEPLSEIYHLGGADKKEVLKESIQVDSYKNRIASYLKNLSIQQVCLILPIHISICFLLVGLYVLRSKTYVSVAIIRALFWNIKNINKTLDKRKHIQNKYRKISDNKIMKYIKINPPISFWIHFFVNPRGIYKEPDLS